MSASRASKNLIYSAGMSMMRMPSEFVKNAAKKAWAWHQKRHKETQERVDKYGRTEIGG